MEIELSEDLQHYKESLVLGLTAKQFLFSALALGVGTETDLYGNPSGRRTGSTAKEKGTEKREERW